MRKILIAFAALVLGSLALVGVSAPANAAAGSLVCSDPSVTGSLSVTGVGSTKTATAVVNDPGARQWSWTIGSNLNTYHGATAVGSFSVVRQVPSRLLFVFVEPIWFKATSSSGVTCSAQVTP